MAQPSTQRLGGRRLCGVQPHVTLTGLRPSIQRRAPHRSGHRSAAVSSPVVAHSYVSSDALVRVADLASAWGRVSRRLSAEPMYDSFNTDKVIRALRLSLSCLEAMPPRADGRQPAQRAVQLAVSLAELCAAGLPLDADAIAAGVLIEAADSDSLSFETIQTQLGDEVAALVHDVMRVRTAPQRVELYDDTAASALREWAIAFCDVRACCVEVVSRWDEMRAWGTLPGYERQLLALEALQVYAPLGHALGMGAVSAAMEDAAFQVLFPDSYMHTAQWLHTVVDPAEDALFLAQQQLLAALDTHPHFRQLASGCQVKARTKSLFSLMKKLLRLGEMSKGGRQPHQVFDLLGMRVVVQPRADLPSEEAEVAATEACRVVQQVVQQLWHVVADRTKDYLSQPKANGYRSLHLTVCLKSVMMSQAGTGNQQKHGCKSDLSQAAGMTAACSQAATGVQPCCEGGRCVAARDLPDAPHLEVQIRTQAMDDRAETGDASHSTYKGGLDAQQARQLQQWCRSLQDRLSLKPQGKLLLPPSIVAQHEGAMTALESCDWDCDPDTVVDVTPEDPSMGSDCSVQPAVASSAPNTASRSGKQQLQVSQGAQHSSRPAQQQQGVSKARRRAASPTEQLFKALDVNKDGKLSLDELQDGLLVPDWAAYAPVSSNSSSSYGTLYAAGMGGGGSPGVGWDIADGSVRFISWQQQQQTAVQPAMHISSAQTDWQHVLEGLSAGRQGTQQDLSMAEFAALLKQAIACRREAILQEQRSSSQRQP